MKKLKVHIKTYGCQMNKYDSDLVKSLLTSKDMLITDNEKEADVIILNTCSVREKAENKIINKLQVLINSLKKDNTHIKIGIMGCMAQRIGKYLIKKMPKLDFAVGVNQILKIPEIIQYNNYKDIDTLLSFDSELQYNSSLTANPTIYSGRIEDYIAVMRGCNMFCTYCIVPYVRGREKSRSIEDIIKEISLKVKYGLREVTLVGQNISAYGKDLIDKDFDYKTSLLPELLKKVHQIESLERIKFISAHPYFFDDELINTISNSEKISKNIHLVLQSGSNKILTQMNRKYDVKMYLNVINKLKSKINDIKFSTDIIVGFPNETEEDFESTRNVFNNVKYDNAYIFMYSPREGTMAIKKYEDNIPLNIKKRRNQILLNDLKRNIFQSNNNLIGKELNVLIKEQNNDNGISTYTGEALNGKIIKITTKKTTNIIGNIAQVYIENFKANTLFGKMIDQ